jgi:hypothetical protein
MELRLRVTSKILRDYLIYKGAFYNCLAKCFLGIFLMIGIENIR